MTSTQSNQCPNNTAGVSTVFEEFLGPLVKRGLKSVMLFGVVKPESKDATASIADSKDGPVIQATTHYQGHVLLNFISYVMFVCAIIPIMDIVEFCLKMVRLRVVRECKENC